MQKVESQNIPDKVRRALAPWLHWPVILAAAIFVGLNAIDGCLTNYAVSQETSCGLAKSLEANPFLNPISGHWALSFKGLAGVILVGIMAGAYRFTQRKLLAILIMGCIAIAGVIIWNLHCMGMWP